MVAIADYPSFVVAVVVFLMIPGPGNLALVTSTGKGGTHGGLAATLGVIVGDHADVLGDYDRIDIATEQPMNTGIFRSGAGFGDDQFFELYRRVASALS